MKAVRGKVSESGRLTLPAEFRRAVGLERGGDVVVALDGREIKIRTVAEIIAHAQSIMNRALHGKSGASVDDFLAERRR